MYGNACALRESVFKDKIVLTKAIALEIITKTVGSANKTEIVKSQYLGLSDKQTRELVLLANFVERHDNLSEAIALVCEYLDCIL